MGGQSEWHAVCMHVRTCVCIVYACAPRQLVFRCCHMSTHTRSCMYCSSFPPSYLPCSDCLKMCKRKRACVASVTHVWFLLKMLSTRWSKEGSKTDCIQCYTSTIPATVFIVPQFASSWRGRRVLCILVREGSSTDTAYAHYNCSNSYTFTFEFIPLSGFPLHSWYECSHIFIGTHLAVWLCAWYDDILVHCFAFDMNFSVYVVGPPAEISCRENAEEEHSNHRSSEGQALL